jgi:hypothetical protein
MAVAACNPSPLEPVTGQHCVPLSNAINGCLPPVINATFPSKVKKPSILMSDIFVYSGCETKVRVFEKLKMFRATISMGMNRDRRRVQASGSAFPPKPTKTSARQTPAKLSFLIDCGSVRIAYFRVAIILGPRQASYLTASPSSTVQSNRSHESVSRLSCFCFDSNPTRHHFDASTICTISPD